MVVFFIRLNYFILDMFGIVFRMFEGLLFYIGDFKIDYILVGLYVEYEKLVNLG